MEIQYYNFGEDAKYLKNVKIKITDCKKNQYFSYVPARYICETKTIEVCKDALTSLRGTTLRKIIAHEQSHAIIDIKYGIWDNIIYPFSKKYGEKYNSIARKIAKEMKGKLEKDYKEADKRLTELIIMKLQPESSEEYIITEKVVKDMLRDFNQVEDRKRIKIVNLNMYCYKNIFDTINEISKRVEKEFRKKYGNRAGELVHLIHEIEGLDELLAYAVSGEGLDEGIIDRGICYLFNGTITVYAIRKMLEDKGYPCVSNALFSRRVKRARSLIDEILYEADKI